MCVGRKIVKNRPIFESLTKGSLKINIPNFDIDPEIKNIMYDQIILVEIEMIEMYIGKI